jgi:hypothetical protein
LVLFKNNFFIIIIFSPIKEEEGKKKKKGGKLNKMSYKVLFIEIEIHLDKRSQPYIYVESFHKWKIPRESSLGISLGLYRYI